MPTPQEAPLDQEFYAGEFMVRHKAFTFCVLVAGLEFEGVPVFETVAKVASALTYFSRQ